MGMKKAVSLLLALAVLMSLLVPVTLGAATSDAPKRVINLVYDDSGSMIKNDADELVDTWCQAKYAIEVFAALLGENDSLNVYVMSDYSRPKLVLKGSEGASANVGKVHSMITNASGTPFGSVKKAYEDLRNLKADEKWLVVLTDGSFEPKGQVDVNGFFAQKSADIKVMFLGMGKDAEGITENKADNIYYKKAKNTKEILAQVTDISTQIFNSNKLEVNAATKTFDFDVPMGELVVFAQGAKVKINGIKGPDKKLIKSTTEPVTVMFSETPATNYSKFIVDRNLLGSVATFKGDFDSGNYTVDVTGAETIEIYYKPNIDIAAYLKDKDGNEVTDLTALEAGDYKIEFGFVKAGTTQKVEELELLGKVKYKAVVTNNGVTHGNTYANGDEITLEEGDLSIDVTATYLEYNTVSTLLNYTIFKNKKIKFEVVDGPRYVVESNGFKEAKPIVVKATLDGKDFTSEQWSQIGCPKVELAQEQDFEMGKFEIKKTEEPGVYHIKPTLEGGKPSCGTYSDCKMKVHYSAKHGEETWSGNSKLPIDMKDNRSWLERNKDLVIKLIVSGIILFILLGYVPGIKKYLPSRLKARPAIIAEPRVPGNEVEYYKGRLEKSLISTIIPYIPQRGTLKFVPSGVFGVPRMELRASGGKRMLLLNTRAFGGKDNITIGTGPVAEGAEKMKITAGVMLVVEDTEWVYTCQPNVERSN